MALFLYIILSSIGNEIIIYSQRNMQCVYVYVLFFLSHSFYLYIYKLQLLFGFHSVLVQEYKRMLVIYLIPYIYIYQFSTCFRLKFNYVFELIQSDNAFFFSAETSIVLFFFTWHLLIFVYIYIWCDWTVYRSHDRCRDRCL